MALASHLCPPYTISCIPQHCRTPRAPRKLSVSAKTYASSPMEDDLICCMILQRSWAGRCHPMAGFTTGTRRPGITNPLFTSQDTQLLCWGPALPRHSWTLHSQSLGAAPLFARILVKNPDYCYLQQHVNANYFWTVALRSQTMFMPTLLAMLSTLEAYNPTRSTSACCRRLRKVDVASPPQAAKQHPYTMRYGAR